MRFLKREENNDIKNQLVIEHKGNTLPWSMVAYRNLDINDNLVHDINRYWSMLPVDVQDKIFLAYQNAYDCFNEIERTDRLDQALVQIMKELFDYHPFEDIMRYIHMYSNLKWPTDLKTEYHEDHTEQLTYLKHEYYELIGLVMVMKIALPIWGEYLSRIHSDAGNNKDYRAAGLLYHSNIIHSTAYKRLKSYIETFWEGNTKEHSNAAIVAGLDSDQVPSWLMGYILVRRIANQELVQANSLDEPRMLVSLIFNSIHNSTDTLDKTFGGRINDKGLDSGSVGEDDNTSVAENYKIKSDISEGIQLTHQVYLINKPEDILRRLDPTADIQEYYRYMKLFEKHLTDFQFTTYGKAVTQWVLHPVVTAGIIEYVNYQAVVSMYILAYTLLKHWEFDHVACMLLAQPVSDNLGVCSYSLRQLTAEQLQKLDEIYVDSPNDMRKRQRSRQHRNVAANAILTLITPLYGSWWKTVPWEDQQLIIDLHGDVMKQVIATPFDIIPALADLIIHLKTKIHPGLASIVPSNAPQQ